VVRPCDEQARIVDATPDAACHREEEGDGDTIGVSISVEFLNDFTQVHGLHHLDHPV